MNKIFASLGTAISRDEAKKVIGGRAINLEFDGSGGLSCEDECTKDSDCTGAANKCKNVACNQNQCMWACSY